MSMIGYLAAVDERTQQAMRRDPDLIVEFIDPEDPEERPAHAIRLGKMWQAIHFMLTGDPFGGKGAFALAVLGGEEVGIDVGYGPARLLTPEEVRSISSALHQLSTDDFKKKFSASAMEAAMIYPQGIWERDKAILPEELAHYYEQLVAFYREAARRNDGAILWLS